MVAHASNCRLSGFSIRRPAKTEAANGLYANGRHQCEVIIDVVKETCGPDGEWIAVPLTDEERASVTVVEWSEHDTQTLTPGWRCDEQRNEFALGLWRGAPPQEQQNTEEVIEWDECPEGERISRYLRCDPDAPIGPAVFMARVVIDGGVYTTHGSTNGVAFESAVTISSVAPLELDVAELELYMDVSAYTSDNTFRTNVHVYYWTPPKGMHFVKNMGFDNPLGIPGEGKDFKSTFIHRNPLESDINKAGTFINKDDPNSLLYLDEIQEGLPVPSPNPLVRFNERPTIMRAVRLKSKLVADDRDTKSAWRLLDNYGTEQKFFLGPSGSSLPGLPYLYLTGTLAPPPIKVAHFRIMLPNGGVSTNELYANGRHQCKVVVEIAVEQMQPDGSWARIRLTDEQRDSLTVTRYSQNVNEPLPRGWSCDNEKNIYDTGLWHVGAEEAGLDKSADLEVGHSKAQMEVVDRYMRLESNIPIEEVRFMAAVTVGEVRYTTNYASEDVSFNSYVNIRAVMPYRLSVGQLLAYADLDAYRNKYCDIDVYYWTPPTGLRFLVNRGLDKPMSTPTEGWNFRTSYYRNNNRRSIYKAGVVLNKDVVNPRVLVGDIHSAVPNGPQEVVRFNQRQTIMRAVRFTGQYNSTLDGDSNSLWSLWDNYGCEHRFRLAQSDKGNVIDLQNA
jgi:hypothetical protein